MKTVRDTLYDSLFTQSPPFMGDVLREHEAEVFPGKQIFQQFLREGDGQKRIEQAKSILRRLAFESELLVPSQLTSALLRAEEEVGPRRASPQYIPQDHFVHLVHLYLLGIYIFTHHKKLHRSLTRFFEDLRHKQTIELRTLSDEAAFLDFVFAWRAFVLLHDVGYVWELGLEEDDVVLKECRSLWNSMGDSMASELTAYYLSRIATWKTVDSDNASILLETTGINYVPEIGQKENRRLMEFTFVDEFARKAVVPKSASRVPIIHGTRFISTLTALVKPSSLIALLVHSRLGDVACAIIPDSEGKHIVRRYHNLEGYADALLIKMAFSEGRTPSQGKDRYYEWQLFCPNYPNIRSTFNDSLRSITDGQCTALEIDKLCDDILSEAPAPLLTITSERDYRDSEFSLYCLLADWRRLALPRIKDAEQSNYSMVNKIAISQEKTLGKLLANSIELRINAHLAKYKSESKSKSMQEGIEQLIRDALVPLKDLEQLAKDFETEYGSEMRRKTGSAFQRRRIFEALFGVSKRCLGGAGASTSADSEAHRLSSAILGKIAGKVPSVDAILKTSGAPPLDVLLDCYCPSYLDKTATDHGLAGAVCAMMISSNLESILKVAQRANENRGETTDDTILGKYAQIALSFGEKVQADEALYQVECLMNHVSAAIALHNLYPANLAGLVKSDFKIDLKRSPFSYFAMLCDALQTWDRDRRLMQSSHSLLYKTSGDGYNIHVEGDVIKITEFDHGLDIAKRAEEVKKGLESYLRGSKHLIWLELGEWRH